MLSFTNNSRMNKRPKIGRFNLIIYYNTFNWQVLEAETSGIQLKKQKISAKYFDNIFVHSTVDNFIHIFHTEKCVFFTTINKKFRGYPRMAVDDGTVVLSKEK